MPALPMWENDDSIQTSNKRAQVIHGLNMVAPHTEPAYYALRRPSTFCETLHIDTNAALPDVRGPRLHLVTFQQ
jgi:hypothetical protein